MRRIAGVSKVQVRLQIWTVEICVMRYPVLGPLSFASMLQVLCVGAVSAETISFVYGGWSGGNSKDSTSESMQFSLTYTKAVHGAPRERSHILFNTVWFTTADIGSRFSAKANSVGFDEFVTYLTNGADDELYFSFGFDVPQEVTWPTGGGFYPRESLVFSGCSDKSNGSPCLQITEVQTPKPLSVDLSDYEVTDIFMTVIDAKTYVRRDSTVCKSGCATFEAELKIEFEVEPKPAPSEVLFNNLLTTLQSHTSNFRSANKTKSRASGVSDESQERTKPTTPVPTLPLMIVIVLGTLIAMFGLKAIRSKKP